MAGLEIRGIETMEGRVVNDVFLTDCRVPPANVIGREGRAWHQLVRGLSISRLIIAAMSLSSPERSLQDTVAYVSEREQFGRPIGRF